MQDIPSVPPVVAASFAVLAAVSDAGPAGANVHDVCRATGLHRRSAYRHLGSLRALGMIEQTGEHTGRFRLGPAAAGLAVQASDQKTFLRRARAFADSLTERTGEPVHVTVYDQGTAVTIATASGEVMRSTEAAPVVLGSRRPAHASASGKLFLAYNRTALSAYLVRPLQSFTEFTIVDGAALRAECAAVRKRGWSTDQQENRLGVSCVAVPVWGVNRRVVGAIVVSTQQEGIEDERRAELLGQLLPASEEFTRLIGGEPQ